MKSNGNDIYQLTRQFILDGRFKEFIEVLMQYISKDNSLTVVEGYMFSNLIFQETFYAIAFAQGFRVQHMTLPCNAED